MVRLETVPTSLGPVRVRIVEGGFQPVVVVVRGAFADPDALEWLQPEGADAAFLHLPGFHTPGLSTVSIKACGQAFDEAVGELFAERPLVVVGLSVGALASLAMHAPSIRARVLIEPFFSTLQLWPFREWVRSNVAPDYEAGSRWLEPIFGISADGQAERDYSGLLRRDVPTIAILGDRPLMPLRPIKGFPSFTGAADRTWLRAHGVEVREVAAGHDVPAAAPDAIRTAVADALRLCAP